MAGMREQAHDQLDAVTVEIYDQTYTLRGPDPEAVRLLAGKVDATMRALTERGGPVDSLRVAVLAALNLADEVEMLRARYEELRASLQTAQKSVRSMGSRAGSLGSLLDDMLEAPAGAPADERRAG